MSDHDGVLHEAYQRLRATGPEFEGWLTNHGPMAVEALVRHGHGPEVHPWLDRYATRLDEAPGPVERITADSWREALGDPRRLGDWPRFFEEQLADAEWSAVLATWWPRLLPGIAAGATHGVIRVGHVVRVLREDGASAAGVAELAQALGYWAARWQPVPRAPLRGGLAPDAALQRVPRLDDRHQAGGIVERLERLPDLPGWLEAQTHVAEPATDDVAPFLRRTVTAAVASYATGAHGSPVMLVHAATAPNAVLRVLPSLPRDQWRESAATAWAAAAAVQAAYLPAEPVRAEPSDAAPEDVLARAVAHGDEHVVKLADTALDVHAWTGDPAALAAIHRAVALVDPL